MTRLEHRRHGGSDLPLGEWMYKTRGVSDRLHPHCVDCGKSATWHAGHYTVDSTGAIDEHNGYAGISLCRDCYRRELYPKKNKKGPTLQQIVNEAKAMEFD